MVSYSGIACWSMSVDCDKYAVFCLNKIQIRIQTDVCHVCPAVTNGSCVYDDVQGGIAYFMGGQRIIPFNCSSGFVWRPTPLTSFPLTYQDWAAYEPDCAYNHESCLSFWGAHGYAWNDMRCELTACSVCQIDTPAYYIIVWAGMHSPQIGLPTPADEIPGDFLSLWRFRESSDFLFTNVPPKTNYFFVSYFLLLSLIWGNNL